MLIDRSSWPVAISIAETASLLGLGRTKIYELIRSGDLKTMKVGRRTLVSVASIQVFAEAVM
jgi:excisionase family DNA binding protein